MDKFHLILSPRAIRDLDAFNDAVCKRITSAMKILEENPFPRGKLIKKIKGTASDYYRLRAEKYRVFYFIEGNRSVVLRVLSKKDAGKFISKLN
ncbi:MAG TPA: type II toxin-antitoxin system RelE/ParE family toxin [Thermodesulfovibrionales bacterium]|nr:type II toxin-antitoxin system RelE/ParE family toxin [Thermodesulfovibrionales bacterium]